MMMRYDTPLSIDALVADLVPVRPVRRRDGMALALALSALAVIVMVVWRGARQDLLTGLPDAMFFLRGVGLLALGLVTGWAALAMARPAVSGQPGKYWQFALVLAALFPLAALLQYLTYRPDSAILVPIEGLRCLIFSGLGALLVGSGMTTWLRRGAALDANRAGWLVGLSAGSFGAMAYGFHCPFNSVIYNGLWYSLAVVLCAVAGRMVVPGWLRW